MLALSPVLQYLRLPPLGMLLNLASPLFAVPRILLLAHGSWVQVRKGSEWFASWVDQVLPFLDLILVSIGNVHLV